MEKDGRGEGRTKEAMETMERERRSGQMVVKLRKSVVVNGRLGRSSRSHVSYTHGAHDALALDVLVGPCVQRERSPLRMAGCRARPSDTING